MYVAALIPIGPGVVWLIATMSVNSLTVSHWCFSTTSCWMSEIMAYPPPKLNIPIFVNVMNNLRNSMMIVFYWSNWSNKTNWSNEADDVIFLIFRR